MSLYDNESKGFIESVASSVKRWVGKTHLTKLRIESSITICQLVELDGQTSTPMAAL